MGKPLDGKGLSVLTELLKTHGLDYYILKITNNFLINILESKMIYWFLGGNFSCLKNVPDVNLNVITLKEISILSAYDISYVKPVIAVTSGRIHFSNDESSLNTASLYTHTQ